MNTRNEVPLPIVGLAGFDVGLSEEEQGAQQAVHRFARDVMRPLAREIDRTPADQAYAKGSPFWTFHAEALKLGVDPDAMSGLHSSWRSPMCTNSPNQALSRHVRRSAKRC
jgi:acyl-CoA dehydrogenase